MPLVWFLMPQQFSNSAYRLMMSGTPSSKTEILSFFQDYYKGLRNVFINPPGYQTQGAIYTYTWIPHDADPSWYSNRANKVFYKILKPLIDAVPNSTLYDDKFIREIDTDFYKYWKQRK